MLIVLLGLFIWRIYPDALLDYIVAVETAAFAIAMCVWAAGEIDRARKGVAMRGKNKC